MANRGEFELDRYLRVSAATKADEFDWSRMGPKLDDDALFCLGYMMDIEEHTIVYLRELLSTSVIKDAEVTAFLSCWAYEELFHSLLLKRFLIESGVAIDDGRIARMRTASLSQRALAALTALLSRLSRDFPAVHMTWGAINELSTLSGYRALIERTRHPLLTVLLSRIIKDERRHFAFYYAQAHRRLEASPAAQRLTSLLLRHFWAPVGTSVRGDAAMQRMFGYLFSAPGTGQSLLEIDHKIAALPGLGWFDLAGRYWRQSGAAPVAALAAAL